MSKVNKPVPSDLLITSMKDAGYQGAKAGESMRTVAQYVIAKCPTFLDSIPDEQKSELRAGWMLRSQELNPAVTYSAEWVPVAADSTVQGKSLATLEWAHSYSQQAFGQMKEESKVKHGIIKGLRDAFSKYQSNRMSDLRGAVVRLQKEGQTHTRPQAKNFSTYTNDIFKDMKARCKTAKARNDESAPDEVLLRVEIDKFLSAVFK